MTEKSPSSPTPSPAERQKRFLEGLDTLNQDSQKATHQAERVLEMFKKDPFDSKFLPLLGAMIKSWEGQGLSPQWLLQVPHGSDPYEFYVKEIAKTRTKLWEALPQYAKDALKEAHGKIEPSNSEKLRIFEKSMIDLGRAYQKTPDVFSEKNVRTVLGLAQKETN